MKKCIVLLFCAVVPFLLPAQAIFYVASGTTLSVKSNTIFHAGGLTLVPGTAYALTDVTFQKNSSLVHPSANLSIARSYYFSRPMPAFTGYMQINYRVSELNGLTELLLQPNIHNGTSWQAYPSLIVDVVDNHVVSNVLSSAGLSEITLASISQPLSLDEINLNAERKSRVNELTWTINRQTRADHFDVEYSTDSKNWFVALANISASQNDGDLHTYHCTDRAYKPAYLIYRIAITDLDGRKNYSGVASLSAVSDSDVPGIFPNPATDRFYISGMETTSISEVALYNGSGQLLRQWPVAQAVYRLPSLPTGVYIVSVKSKSGLLQSSRLVVR